MLQFLGTLKDTPIERPLGVLRHLLESKSQAVRDVVSAINEGLVELREIRRQLHTSHSLAQRTLEIQEQQLALLRSLDAARSSSFAQGQIESALLSIRASDPKYTDPRRLNRYEFEAFSQMGEDGIVQEILRRIGVTNRYFIEFGVEAGLENNTAYLLLQGWSGLWIEPERECVAAIETGLAPLVREGRLKVLNAAVTRENVQDLFAKAGVPDEPDLLGIDIDGNDYHVWEAIERYRPRVVVIEYNAVFPPPAKWVMPYDPDYRWNGTIKFGASLESMAQLGQTKGYALVGCSLGGSNAFFVREDLASDHFDRALTTAQHYEPPRYFLQQRECSHRRTYEVFGLR